MVRERKIEKNQEVHVIYVSDKLNAAKIKERDTEYIVQVPLPENIEHDRIYYTPCI